MGRGSCSRFFNGTSACPQLAHVRRQHTHTCTHTHTHGCAYTPFLSKIFTLRHSHTHILTFLFHSLSLSLLFSLSHTHTRAHTHSPMCSKYLGLHGNGPQA